jgi:hypothetical protein
MKILILIASMFAMLIPEQALAWWGHRHYYGPGYYGYHRVYNGPHYRTYRVCSTKKVCHINHRGNLQCWHRTVC